MREYRILHLSDTHVDAEGVDEDGVDAVAALECLLASVARVPDIDLTSSPAMSRTTVLSRGA